MEESKDAKKSEAAAELPADFPPFKAKQPLPASDAVPRRWKTREEYNVYMREYMRAWRKKK